MLGSLAVRGVGPCQLRELLCWQGRNRCPRLAAVPKAMLKNERGELWATGVVLVVGDWSTDMHMAPEIAISVVFMFFFVSFFLIINNAFFHSLLSLHTSTLAEVNSHCKLSHANKSKSS